MSKITLLDLGYSFAEEISDYHELLRLYEQGSGHHPHMANDLNLHVIRHLDLEKHIVLDKINYHFFRGKKSKYWLPLRLHFFARRLKPDVVLLHGFQNPLQVLLLSFQVNTTLVLQHHGGGIPSGLTGLLWRLVKWRVSHYIFTAEGQAADFVTKGLIRKKSKIFAVMEGSTHKKKIAKESARKSLGHDATTKIFLWVGRLDKNKDPITVLKGLEKIFKTNPDPILLMIYSDNTLLEEVEAFVQSSEILCSRVNLLGELPHEKLDLYYSGADYFVLGSHYEGSGFALCEAMACGCIPLVTDIPSFRMMTNGGKLGQLWDCENIESLVSSTQKLLTKNITLESLACSNFFETELSFEAIGRKLVNIFDQILNKGEV